jgi:3-deoxy-D-manno-octulosonic-acid transferase
MVKRGGYSRDFSQRFGLCPDLPPPPKGTARLWIQAVSVGEIQAIRPLVDALCRRDNVELIITTTTSTGYQLALDTLKPQALHIGLFPLDFVPFSSRTWRRLKPTATILMEGELWPEHLNQAHRRKCPVFLVNARLSDRSFRRYCKVRRAVLHILKRLTHILAATEQDAGRYRELGAADEKVHVTGSLKFDVEISPRLSNPERSALRAQMGFGTQPDTPAAIVLLGSSTWPGEEEMLLETLDRCRSRNIDCRLLIVPRHAERRAEVARTLTASGRNWHQRSVSPTANGAMDIYLGDTTGELQQLSQAADLAFIGKSLPPHDGGQTPIEVAALGIPSVYGPRMSNFRQICRSLEQSGAARQCRDRETTVQALLELIVNSEERLKMATAAQIWHRQNRGAAARTIELIERHLCS